MKTKLWIAALLGSALMAQNAPLANGIYAIRNVKQNDSVVRKYQGRELVLDTANFAPLVIEGKPEVRRDGSGSSLTVRLGPEAAKRLEELTKSHLNQPIAVVVGDRILTTPTVRSVIKDTAQVGPCDDEACESLLRQLGK